MIIQIKNALDTFGKKLPSITLQLDCSEKTLKLSLSKLLAQMPLKKNITDGFLISNIVKSKTLFANFISAESVITIDVTLDLETMMVTKNAAYKPVDVKDYANSALTVSTESELFSFEFNGKEYTSNTLTLIEGYFKLSKTLELKTSPSTHDVHQINSLGNKIISIVNEREKRHMDNIEKSLNAINKNHAHHLTCNFKERAPLVHDGKQVTLITHYCDSAIAIDDEAFDCDDTLDIQAKANQLAKEAGTDLKTIELPLFLQENATNLAIVALANSMGYFRNGVSLYDLLQGESFFINESLVTSSVWNDNFDDFAIRVSDKPVFSAKTNVGIYNFTMRDICNAVVDLDGRWCLSHANQKNLIVF